MKCNICRSKLWDLLLLSLVLSMRCSHAIEIGAVFSDDLVNGKSGSVRSPSQRALLIRIENRCLDVEGSETTNNQPIRLWDCHEGDSQKWYYSYSTLEIRSLSNKCLGILPNSNILSLMNCDKSKGQKWSPFKVSNKWNVRNNLTHGCLGTKNIANNERVFVSKGTCDRFLWKW